jgi:c-di-GMP-binding flagellar brake protein YcgR
VEVNTLATTLLRPGKNVQLEFYDENNKKIIYRTSIWNFEAEQLSLVMPKNDYILKNLKPGVKISVICRNGGGSHDYVFSTEFITAESEQPLLMISKPSELGFGIGRYFFRCEVNLPFHYFAKKEKCKGEVTNLSANGLYATVSPNLHLEPGAVLTCQITLPNTKEPLLFVAKVVRVIKKENFQGIGLNFQHIDKNLQDHITQYLFQRQRALINLGQIRIVKND